MGPQQGTAFAGGQAFPTVARQGFSNGAFTKSSKPPRPRRRPTAWASKRGPGSRHAQEGHHAAHGHHRPSRVEWDEDWNIPRVTRSVEYSALLRDIRLEKVQEVRFFSHDNTDFMTGWCLVAYNDGTVARSFIEPDDFRMAYAMETHGVKALRIAVEPSAAELRGAGEWSTAAVTNFVGVFAAGAILLIYAATHYVRMKKGDAADREKLRKKAREERKKKQKQMILDTVEDEVIEQFKSGASVETIVSRGQLGDADIGKTDVENILVRAGLLDARDLEANQAKAAEEGIFYNTDDEAQREAEEAYRQQVMDDVAAQDPNAQAEEMLKMKTIRIRKAEDPIRQRQIREAQRKLRGVKLQYSDAGTIFFDDVAGIGDAKLELQEVVDFFTKPERFKASGAKVPRGVLLTGPPGTGKTLLARAVAGEAGVAFLSINASEFVEMFVGVGAARVRDLFGTARAMAPGIVFIDEIDSVGRARGGAQGNDERDQTLNQLLTEMDGFGDDEMEEKDTRVVVLAASNRPDVLDSALVRPGRFDRSVHVGLPDFEGRVAILRVHLDRRRWDRKQVDLHRLAFETRGYSGARLANLVNMASTVAGQRSLGKSQDDRSTDGSGTPTPYHPSANLPVTVTMDDLERALEMERLGPPRAPYSDAARRRLALAEATTCTLITLLPAIEPVVKATVVARETFPLGHTVVESNEQRELSDVWTLCLLRQQLIAVLGPRAAEEIVYGDDGASSMHARRIALARRIANKMVVANAMTDAIGPRLAAHPTGPADEMDLIVTRFLPEDVSQSVDDAIHAVMEKAYSQSRDMVARNMGAIQAITEFLMRQDTIMGDQVREIVLDLANADDLARREREKADFM